MKLHDLKEQRDGKVAEFRALASKEAEGAALADNERTRADALEGEIRNLDNSIRRADALAEMERRSADAEPVGERAGGPDLSRYSLTRALSGMANGRIDGIEGECHAELSRGRETRGVMVPTEILLGERRAGQTVNVNPAGGYLVATQLDGVADRFRPALRTEAMGARVIPGLNGFVDLPILTASGSAEWVGENGAPTRSAATFAKKTMSPRTVAAEYAMSRRIMLQTGQALDGLLRADLGFLLAQKLDLAAINGSGVRDPLGLLNAGIEKVTTETAFSDTTANLIAALELDDVTGTRAYLTNPKVMRVARKTRDLEGRTIPIPMLFHNERVEVSTQVPDNIGAGSNKNALIYGQWGELVIGYWSGVDILANPYHSDVASSGGTLLHAFLDTDVVVRHLEAFAYAEIS